MSLHFDLAISCDLREDTPETYLQAIRYLTDTTYELESKPQLIVPGQGDIWNSYFENRFLVPNPEYETISSFRKIWRTSVPLENNRDVYRYSLQFSGRMLHDDFFYEAHIPFVYWVASIIFGDFIGYFKETNSIYAPQMLFVKDGKLIDP